MKILIPVNVYQKLRGYVQATNFEISGLGKVVMQGQDFLIEDVKIFEQEVSYANTKLDKKALAKFYDELMQRDEDPGDWKLWWHSHAKMDTFWSGTDSATIDDFDTEMEANNWILALETNRKDEIITRIDIFKPLRVTVPDIPWEITFENKQIEDDAFNEAIEKIKTPAYVPKKNKIIVDGKKILDAVVNKNRLNLVTMGDDGTPLFPPDNGRGDY
jgi:hypothetical protein